VVLDDPESTGQQAMHRLKKTGFHALVSTWKPLKPKIAPNIEVKLVSLKVDDYIEVKTRLLRNL